MSWAPAKKETSLGLSKETAAFLQENMKQKGLSQRAVEDIANSIQRGDSKWVEHLNKGTSTFRSPASSKSKVKVPKVGTGPSRPPAVGPTARFSGIKLQSEILRDNPPEREQFPGAPPGPDREKEKDRLNLVFQHGAEGVAEMEARAAEAAAAAEEAARRPRKAVDVREAMIDQIIDEIRERREFLEDLAAKGAHSNYEATVRAEIASRIAELRNMGLDVGDTNYARRKPAVAVPGLR